MDVLILIPNPNRNLSQDYDLTPNACIPCSFVLGLTVDYERERSIFYLCKNPSNPNSSLGDRMNGESKEVIW